MSTLQPTPSPTTEERGMPPLLRGAMWVAIIGLIAAAILCVIWVLFSPDGDVIPKAFLTILLLAGFAGVSLLDAHLAAGRPAWVVPVSMGAWVLALICGLTLLWTPTEGWYGPLKVWNFILIVVFIQLAVLHQRLLWRAHKRYVTGFTRTLMIVTTALVAALLLMALLPLTLPQLLDYPDLYGRIMVALAILGAVGTALVPLITGMFGPKKPAPAVAPAAQGLLPWPTYPGTTTPLPMLPNGQPDFHAQASGVPSPGARVYGAAPHASQPAAPQDPTATMQNPPAPPQYPSGPPAPPRGTA